MALVVPLARQLAIARFSPRVLSGLTALCLAASAVTVAMTRPPELPAPAAQAAHSTAGLGTVLANWRWAGELQRRLGPSHQVWAGNGLNSESKEFWLDYLRVSQGHVHWAEILRQENVDLLVLDAAGQQRQVADLVRTSADWRVTFDANGVLVAERR